MLTGDTRLTQYGRYYFDYNSATTAASMEIVFAKSPTPTPTGETEQYLTFDILSDGDIILYNDESTNNKTIYYSVNDGDWVTVTINPSKIYINLRNGDKIRLKGNNESYNGNKIQVDTNANVYGNIMSLIYGDNFVGQIALPSEMNFGYIFSGSKIVNAANLILPVTTLAPYCYENMFRDCTLLTTAPALPAITLANSCYQSMFQGCTSLTTAPELPVTTLAYGCYNNMFRGCTSLTQAPVLPATTLVTYCYSHMFYNCTKLNYIKCLATDISAGNCTSNWVSSVASTGTFVKNPNMTSWTTDVNGAPTGWTVVDNS